MIADTSNVRVRVVAARTGSFYGQAMTAGDIYTVAGISEPGFYGDRGPATKAGLSWPDGVAVDHAGNLLIADILNVRVRVVAARTGTLYGQAMHAGNIYTVAGGGSGRVSGARATSAFIEPDSVAVDHAGNLVITDAAYQQVWVVAARTGSFYGQAMTAGDIYLVAGNGDQGFTGDGGPATSAELNQPADVAVDDAGNLVITDYGNNRIRVVATRTGTFYGQTMTAGDIYTIAGSGFFGGFSGDGGPATQATLQYPEGLAVDGAGNVVINDTGNGRIRIVAARTGTFYGQPMTAGDIYTVAGNGNIGYSGDGGPATSAELAAGQEPDGLTVDNSGNILIADAGNNRIREITR